MRAFVVAHVVHYATVFYQAVTDVHTRMHVLNAGHCALIIYGVLLLLPLVFASPNSTTVGRRLNAVAVFLVWATFAGGAAFNAAVYRTALIPLIPLLAGLTIHVCRSVQRFQWRRDTLG